MTNTFQAIKQRSDLLGR